MVEMPRDPASTRWKERTESQKLSSILPMWHELGHHATMINKQDKQTNKQRMVYKTNKKTQGWPGWETAISIPEPALKQGLAILLLTGPRLLVTDNAVPMMQKSS